MNVITLAHHVMPARQGRAGAAYSWMSADLGHESGAKETTAEPKK